MNPTQQTVAYVELCKGIGLLLVAFGAISPAEQANFVTGASMLIGGAMYLSPIAFQFYNTTKAKLLARTAAMPGVEKVVLDPRAPDSLSLNTATPPNVVVGEKK